MIYKVETPSSRANSLGYGNEEIARAMYEQAKTLHYIGSAAM